MSKVRAQISFVQVSNVSQAQQLLAQMWTELVQTSQSGQWYVANPRAAGHWRNAEDLKNRLDTLLTQQINSATL